LVTANNVTYIEHDLLNSLLDWLHFVRNRNILDRFKYELILDT
jgi:hypothetical protein